MRIRDFAKQKSGLLLLGAVVASVLAMGFTFAKFFVFPSSGGSLSPYLVGYYDLGTDDCIRNSNSLRACATEIITNQTDAAIDLSNPTLTSLLAVITLFDEDGAFQRCTTTLLSANETERVYVNDDMFSANGDGKRGVIKIVTLLNSNHTVVQAGVKGTLTHYVAQRFTSGSASQIFSRQSQLQQVPAEVLRKDSNTELLNIVRLGCV